jgi:Arm DNA-binding domain
MRTLEELGVGRHRIAPRLYLQVRSSGCKSWLYRYTFDGRAHSMGVGKFPDVSVDEALERVASLRENYFDPLKQDREFRQRQWTLIERENLTVRLSGVRYGDRVKQQLK